jgi:signal transduction histidine kinase
MHLLSLVEEMLDLSKVEAGKLEIERVPTQPNILLDESLMMLRPAAEAAQVGIKINGSPSSWPVLVCDPVKLKQVFVNILGNAIKFTHPGGRSACQVRQTTSGCEFGSATPVSECDPRKFRW